jgi:hypothetical protein
MDFCNTHGNNRVLRKLPMTLRDRRWSQPELINPPGMNGDE